MKILQYIKSMRFKKNKPTIIRDSGSHCNDNSNSVSSVTDSVNVIPDSSKEQGSESAQIVPEVMNDRAAEETPNSADNNVDVVHDFVRQSTDVRTDDFIFLGASLRGKSHIATNKGCQDYHLYSDLGNGWYLLVVSDGAGSARLAERGSKGNCSVFEQMLKQVISSCGWIEENALPSEIEWYIQCRSIFEKMKLVYRNKAIEMADGTVESDFNATIIVCVVSPLGMLVAHIGDGRMGYLSSQNEWKELMTPHKGEEANQTIFLQNPWTNVQIPALKISGVTVPETHVLPNIPQAVVLMSDGCEHAAWECSMYNEITSRYEDVNKPHPRFMSPLIEAILEEKPEARLRTLIDIMEKGTPSCESEQDDKTMLLAIKQDAIQNTL